MPELSISIGDTVSIALDGKAYGESGEDVRDFVADVDSLEPSTVESWNSGGTAGMLPAERAKVGGLIGQLWVGVGRAERWDASLATSPPTRC